MESGCNSSLYPRQQSITILLRKPTPEFQPPPTITLNFSYLSVAYQNMVTHGFTNTTLLCWKNCLLNKWMATSSSYYATSDHLQVLWADYGDDTIATSNTTFKTHKNEITETLESKPREYYPLLFAGIKIKKNQQGYFIEQNDYLWKI